MFDSGYDAYFSIQKEADLFQKWTGIYERNSLIVRLDQRLNQALAAQSLLKFRFCYELNDR